MKFIVKIISFLFMVVVVAYYGTVYVMPSVTIVNKSGDVIEQAKVALPSSNLNFGALMDAEENTLHYSIEQSDGVYSYYFKTKDSVALRGSCGYVTNNQVHKRVVITLTENNTVVCN